MVSTEARATEACLRNGRWVPLRQPRKLHSFPAHGRYLCATQRGQAVGSVLQYEHWRGDDSSCAQLLPDPLTADFGGLFADKRRPVALKIISESTGEMLIGALSALLAKNQHLRGLSLAKETPELKSKARTQPCSFYAHPACNP